MKQYLVDRNNVQFHLVQKFWCHLLAKQNPNIMYFSVITK